MKSLLISFLIFLKIWVCNIYWGAESSRIQYRHVKDANPADADSHAFEKSQKAKKEKTKSPFYFLALFIYLFIIALDSLRICGAAPDPESRIFGPLILGISDCGRGTFIITSDSPHTLSAWLTNINNVVFTTLSFSLLTYWYGGVKELGITCAPQHLPAWNISYKTLFETHSVPISGASNFSVTPLGISLP